MHGVRPILAPRPHTHGYLFAFIPSHPPRRPDLPRGSLPLLLRILSAAGSPSEPVCRESARAFRFRYKLVGFGHDQDMIPLSRGIGEEPRFKQGEVAEIGFE